MRRRTATRLREIKFDGYRMHARLDCRLVKLLTRTGLDWTHKYPAIAKAVASLDARQAYLDGELCGVGPDGIHEAHKSKSGYRVRHLFQVARSIAYVEPR